jgi:hypothetical protein
MNTHQNITTAVVFLLLLILSVAGFALPITAEAETLHAPAAVFELDFLSGADLHKTTNLLRAEGISAVILDEPVEMIQIEADSYNRAMTKLSQIVPNLPDIYRFVWKHGPTETLLYEAREADILIPKDQMMEDQRALKDYGKSARIKIVVGDGDYESVAKKLENLGYKVISARKQTVVIEIPNNILSFKDTLVQLSELSEIQKFQYNRGPTTKVADEFVLTFKNDSQFNLNIERLLANDIEVYKVDKVLNRIFIHFPQAEARNKIKLRQIKLLEDIVSVQNASEALAQNVLSCARLF